MATPNVLVIPTSEIIKATYNLDTDPTYSLFSQTTTDLILTLQPGSYDKIYSGGVTTKQGFGSRVVMVAQRMVSIEATISDGRAELLKVLSALMATATADPLNVVPITVYDYHDPERADEALGYSTRRGIFTVLEGKGGTVRESSDVTSRRYYQGGIQFTFEDFVPRGY